MERILMKMADQLAEFDEASLTSLWDKYEGVVREFQPTKRWEQAVMILGMIQALRWKNHLFNHHWAAQQKPTDRPEGPTLPLDWLESGKVRGQSKPAKVLPFVPPKIE